MSVHENQQGAVWLSNTTAALSKGGGKPGQGFPAVLVERTPCKEPPDAA